jgi:hypothetical protein
MTTEPTAEEIEPLAHFLDRMTENIRSVPHPGETLETLRARISELEADLAFLEFGGRTLHTIRDTRLRLSALRLEYLILRAAGGGDDYLARRQALKDSSRQLAGAVLAFTSQEITIAREFKRATSRLRECYETRIR